MPFLLAPQMKQSGIDDDIDWNPSILTTVACFSAMATLGYGAYGVFSNFFLADRHTVLRCPSFCRKHVHVCTCYVPSTGYTNHIALVDCVNQRLCRGADLSEIFLFLSVSRIVIGSETSHYPNTTWSTRSSTTYVHPMQVVESTNSEQTPMMFGQHFLAFPFCSPIR